MVKSELGHPQLIPRYISEVEQDGDIITIEG